MRKRERGDEAEKYRGVEKERGRERERKRGKIQKLNKSKPTARTEISNYVRRQTE